MKTVISKGILLSAVLLAANGLSAGDKDKPAPVKLETKVADSGSFGIYLEGKRIGTETFKIEQRADYSIATAEIKVDDGKSKAEQTFEMQISPNGDLRSYTWHATLPVREESSVEPNDGLLMEHLVPADQKKTNVPHMLPLSTTILDDNFFSQREILMWRYLATACVRQNNQLACGPGNYGILVPHQHSAFNVTVELQGPDKVLFRGGLRELNKIVLKTADPQQLVVMNSEKDADSGEWVIWIDDQYKVVKITIAASHVEVVRD